MTEIRERLFALRDEKNAVFVAKLIPTIPPESILGARTPQLRALAKALWKERDMAPFMAALPHAYFEENGLHAFCIEQIRDFDRCLEETERFLPYVDNWATCDSLSPKVFRKHRAELLPAIRRWLDSREPYTIRFGVGMLMEHFLDEDFAPVYLDWVAALRSEEYYVNMMIAWYFATALAKQYEAALPYLEGKVLDPWTHNKTIQKAVESYRVSEERKAYLKTLKRKKTE
ncbi:MAG: DNA alkylation repair protein [Oscillospiraceae bacterium]|nr:DNA alkylation repair protein [Oscillospiraceae bacterium]